MLRIRLAKKGESEVVQSVYHHKSVIGPLNEFTMREGINNRISENATRGTMWLAELDGEVVGAVNVGGNSRGQYPHLLQLGEVGVIDTYRRQRIGTSLYFTKIATAVLEGRRILSDTIVEHLTVMPDLLPTIGLRQVGILPNRTKGFRTILLFHGETEECFRVGWERIPDDIEIELVMSERVEQHWETNKETYAKQNRPDVTSRLAVLRDQILELPQFTVIDNRTEVKDAEA
jgi:hypothetical protein